MTRAHAIAIVLVIAAVATAPAPAAAQESSTFDELTDTVRDVLGVILGGVRGEINRLTDDPADRDADEAVDDLRDRYNANSAAIEAWANERSNATTSLDVLEIELEVDGETATAYLVADVAGDDYENSSLVETTDRTIDETCTLEGDAARNAPDELETFVDEFAEQDRNLSNNYLARLARQYRGEVDCSFLD